MGRGREGWKEGEKGGSLAVPDCNEKSYGLDNWRFVFVLAPTESQMGGKLLRCPQRALQLPQCTVFTLHVGHNEIHAHCGHRNHLSPTRLPMGARTKYKRQLSRP